MNRNAPLALPFALWPARDRAAWEEVLRHRRGLFDQQAVASHLRPATVRKAQAGYSVWLGFLARTGALNREERAGDRATPERLEAWHAEMLARGNRPATMLGRYRELAAALRLIAPKCDVGHILRPHGTALRRFLPPVPRPVTVVPVAVLLDHVEALFASGLRGDSYACGHTAVRDAALLAILATRVPRIGSLAGMELGEHLARVGQGFEVRFSGDDTKTGAPLAWPLPDRICPIIARYLEVDRKAFRGSAGSARLWMGAKGKAMNQRAVTKIVLRRTAAWFGEPKGPHWFRKCLTTSAAVEAPAHALDAAAILGHSPAVALAHYNKATTRSAAMRHTQRVHNLRRQTEGLARSFFRERRTGKDAPEPPLGHAGAPKPQEPS